MFATNTPRVPSNIKRASMDGAKPSNGLPFSSERQGRLRAYHGREKLRAQPAASRQEPTPERKRVAFVCCNGLLSGGPSLVEVIRECEDAGTQQRKRYEHDQEPRRADQTPVSQWMTRTPSQPNS
jgi:hypothetical protein